MKISELIVILEKLKNEHGDLPCITKGFDEHDYDDIGTVEIVSDVIFRPKGAFSHSGQHEEVFIPKDKNPIFMPSNDKINQCEKALFIDF